MLRNLEKFSTRNKKTKNINGNLVPIWRNWENCISPPAMIYITTCFPFEIKGVHCYEKRENNFVCLKGKVVFISKENGGYKEYILSAKIPQMLSFQAKIPACHINIGSEEAIILNCPSTVWHPDQNEQIETEFNEYNWAKWIKVCEEELENYLAQNKDISYLDQQLLLMKDWIKEFQNNGK